MMKLWIMNNFLTSHQLYSDCPAPLNYYFLIMVHYQIFYITLHESRDKILSHVDVSTLQQTFCSVGCKILQKFCKPQKNCRHHLSYNMHTYVLYIITAFVTQDSRETCDNVRIPANSRHVNTALLESISCYGLHFSHHMHRRLYIQLIFMYTYTIS